LQHSAEAGGMATYRDKLMLNLAKNQPKFWGLTEASAFTE